MCNNSSSNNQPPYKEEEYIDYSCSTAVERLARDVESLLRSWHIHNGCDRHFSITTNKHGLTLLRAERLTWIASLPSTGTTTATTSVRMELELALWDGPASKAPPILKKRNSMIMTPRARIRTRTTTAATRTPTNPATMAIAPALQVGMDSNQVNSFSSSSKKKKKSTLRKLKKSAWWTKNVRQTSATTTTATVRSPPMNASRRSSLSNDECVASAIEEAVAGLNDEGNTHLIGTSFSEHPEEDFDDEEDEDEQERHHHLPKALQRPIHPRDLTDMPDSLFDNFSTLFGIGQHITLTPTNPLMDLGVENHDDGDPSSSSTGSWGGDGGPSSALSSLCSSLFCRHQPTQARWVLTQLLGNQLQTALNTAAMNSQSCLPVFGIWGNYPSASLPSSDATSVNDFFGNGVHNNKAGPYKKAMIEAFPSWLDAAQELEASVASRATMQQRQFSPSKSNSKSGGTLSSFSPRRRKRRSSCHAHKLSSSSSSLSPRDVSYNSEPWIKNAHYAPPLVVGSVLPTTHTYANFSCSVMLEPLTDESIDRLSTWGNVLLQECKRNGSGSYSSSCGSIANSDSSVVLSGARHIYAWWKSKIPSRERDEWRGVHPKEYWKQQRFQHASMESEPNNQMGAWGGTASLKPSPAQASLTKEIEDYRGACMAHAFELLEQAMGPACWGPRDDPIYALHGNVVWKSKSITADDRRITTIQGLGSFPSPTESIEYDSALSFLDVKQNSQFKLKAFLDHQALEPSLATNQRCVLACLVRTATLAPLTLLRHLLWEEDIIEDWDHEAGNRAALDIAHRAYVGDATTTLVDVMDWKTCAEEMISSDEALAIVQEVMEGTSFFGFPSPPEDMFSADQAAIGYSNPLLAPLFKSAPIGRLLSDLCVRMAQLRTPCSMALVWSTFCTELRQRWDMREPLPHMNFVPGLDPSPAVLAERRKISTIGVKADLAAFLNCTEPDPDDQHCLIGQKLQVFNIGIEAMALLDSQMEARRHALVEEKKDEETWCKSDTDLSKESLDPSKESSSSPTPARATSLVSLASDALSIPVSKEVPLRSTSGGKIVNLSSLGSFQIPSELFSDRVRNDTIIDGLLPRDKDFRNEDEEEGSTASDSISGEFFDAEECAMSIYTAMPSPFAMNMATSVVHRIDRKGARCPLHGCSLVASGDQVYAPYLQRPEPLTDDIILERRIMLSDKIYTENGDSRVPIQKRLEVAYRLQKPKLLSDMSAFKAANPGSVFQDFVSWYGNPGNPLEDYRSTSLCPPHGGLVMADSAAMKLDKATEAIHILNETRNFWSTTWDEATALPASEQRPLFEVYSTVEMALDYLENMHPAILMNQIMTVNLATAYFLLAVSAKDAVKVEVVHESLQKLRKLTEQALLVLAEEASNATNAFYNSQADDKGDLSNFVSTKTITACEAVCTVLSEAEAVSALATSLLQKFPEQYNVVQTILKHTDGEDIELKDPIAQSHILNLIRMQQQKASKSLNVDKSNVSPPKPVLREYVLRNLDDSNPCQLSVRYADGSVSDASSNGKNSGGLMLALTKSVED